MKRDFATAWTGWLFIAAALMWWGGWTLLPVRIGAYFETTDFAAVDAHLHLWIWLFRFHLFGMVTTALALAALAAVLADSPARVMIWPGAAVGVSGVMVSAVGAAFYYHFGAWGALDMRGQTAEALAGFVESLRVSTEYVTCLVRFGRVFTGLGLVVLGAGLLRWKVMPGWCGGAAIVLGGAAMGITMVFPDQLTWYAPIFHALSLWLAGMGVALLRNGVRRHVPS